MNPLVSVIIPTYNREATVARSIDSVMEQTYHPLEIIVVDDGSTDSTLAALAAYGSKISVICQANGGPSSARNKGVAHAKGEIIAFLDSDDTWKPEKLDRQIPLIVKGGSTVACCVCNAALLSEDGKSITSFEVSEVGSLLAEGYWLNPAPIIATRFFLFNQVVAIRRDVFLQIGGFNENMRLLEDHDLAFRLSLEGPWAFISEALVEKYNDSEGVGVQAMKTPLVHATAWRNALKGFLNEPLENQKYVEWIIRRGLRDSAIEVRAVSIMLSGRPFARAVGQLLMGFLRVRGGIRRRLPSWPKVQAVAELTSPSTTSPLGAALN